MQLLVWSGEYLTSLSDAHLTGTVKEPGHLGFGHRKALTAETKLPKEERCGPHSWTLPKSRQCVLPHGVD